MEEPSKEYDHGFIDGTKEGKRRLQQRIKELEAENKALRRPMESANFEVAGMAAVGNELISRDERIKDLEDLRDTVSINCNPPADCNDPKVLKTYMKACFDEAEKLYD